MLALAVVGVIPWIPARPPAPAVPHLAPRCRVSQLRVRGGGARGGLVLNGAAGLLVGQLTVRNNGRPCSLVGGLRVRFVGGPAAGVPQRQIAFAEDSPTTEQLLSPVSVRALPRRAAVAATIRWRNWCAPGNTGGGRRSPPPTGVVVTLPTGSSVRLKVGHAPRCDLAGSPSTISVSSLAPVVAEPKASTHLPLQVSLDRPEYRGAAGSVLHFRVTLTNVGRRRLVFHTCPVYVEELAPLSHREIHVLNCRPMGALAPGAHAVFAMEARLPQTHPGAFGLNWQVGIGTYQPPSGGARVTVTG